MLDVEGFPQRIPKPKPLVIGGMGLAEGKPGARERTEFRWHLAGSHNRLARPYLRRMAGVRQVYSAMRSNGSTIPNDLPSRPRCPLASLRFLCLGPEPISETRRQGRSVTALPILGDVD